MVVFRMILLFFVHYVSYTSFRNKLLLFVKLTPYWTGGGDQDIMFRGHGGQAWGGRS